MLQSLLTIDPGLMFILRWLHIGVGVAWIGLLYYFNFVQGPYFGEAEPAAKSNAVQKLVPRALWWFRWAAMWTFITGLIMLMVMGHQYGSSGAGFASSRWVNILTGAGLATLMFLNVWLIIWPNQKKVIAGGKDAAAAGARAGLASRTNVLFSIPMLFFMAASQHLPFAVSETSNTLLYVILCAVTIGALQFNAIKGKMGPMASIKGVIHSGLGLTVVFCAFLAICF